MRIAYIILCIMTALGLAWYSNISLLTIGIIAFAAVIFRKPATELFLKLGIFVPNKTEKNEN